MVETMRDAPTSCRDSAVADPPRLTPTAFGLPEQARNLDGYLFPAEYRFPLETSAEEILKTKNNLNAILAKCTGQSVEQIAEDAEREMSELVALLG